MGLLLFQGIFFGSHLVSAYKFAAADVLGDFQLSIAGALGSACNGTSRVFWGSMLDKFGFKRVFFCLQLL